MDVSAPATFPRPTTFAESGAGELTHGPLASLDVNRVGTGGGRHGSMHAKFDLFFASSTEDLWECRTFPQALELARGRAAGAASDGIPEHVGAVFPAQAIMHTLNGTFLVGAVATGHRGIIGPMPIDGPLVDLDVRSIRATTTDSLTDAIVGATRWLDLRGGAPVEWHNPAFSRDHGRIGSAA